MACPVPAGNVPCPRALAGIQLVICPRGLSAVFGPLALLLGCGPGRAGRTGVRRVEQSERSFVARRELARADKYKYQVVNDTVDRAVDEISGILKSLGVI